MIKVSHMVGLGNANYYRDHVFRVAVEQYLNPFVFLVQPEMHLRRYEGVDMVINGGSPTRDDVIYSVVAGIHYTFRNSLAATLDYHFSAVQTDYRYMVDGVVDDPSFVRHQLLAGIHWAM